MTSREVEGDQGLAGVRPLQTPLTPGDTLRFPQTQQLAGQAGFGRKWWCPLCPGGHRQGGQWAEHAPGPCRKLVQWIWPEAGRPEGSQLWNLNGPVLSLFGR